MVNLKISKWAVTALFFCLLITSTTSILAQPNDKNGSSVTEFRLLQDEELKSIRGGTNCQNVNGGSGKTDPTPPITKEPVILNNGDLIMTTTDLSIPALGPDLKISRTYNSQITSRVDYWQPEEGAGPWVI